MFKPTADTVVTDFLIYREDQALRPRVTSSVVGECVSGEAESCTSSGQSQSSSVWLRREEMLGSSWCFTVGSVNLSFT